MFTFAMGAYNLVRMRKLPMVAHLPESNEKRSKLNKLSEGEDFTKMNGENAFAENARFSAPC